MPMILFDTHAHYDDDQFDNDRDLLLNDLPHYNIKLVVNPAVNLESSKKIIEIVSKYSYIYGAVGYYPHNTNEIKSEQELCEIEALAKSHLKIKAIGEIGLDYYYDDTDPETQKKWFRAQMELADSLNLPVIIHDREAHEDCLKIVREFPHVTGVYHCYSGSLEYAKILWNLGYYTSFTGSITFKNAKKAPEIVAACPESQIMIETDSPYLAPVPHRGKRNDSKYLEYICNAAASFRKEDPEEFAYRTYRNGKRFFGID